MQLNILFVNDVETMIIRHLSSILRDKKSRLLLLLNYINIVRILFNLGERLKEAFGRCGWRRYNRKRTPSKNLGGTLTDFLQSTLATIHPGSNAQPRTPVPCTAGMLLRGVH